MSIVVVVVAMHGVHRAAWLPKACNDQFPVYTANYTHKYGVNGTVHHYTKLKHPWKFMVWGLFNRQPCLVSVRPMMTGLQQGCPSNNSPTADLNEEVEGKSLLRACSYERNDRAKAEYKRVPPRERTIT